MEMFKNFNLLLFLNPLHSCNKSLTWQNLLNFLIPLLLFINFQVLDENQTILKILKLKIINSFF